MLVGIDEQLRSYRLISAGPGATSVMGEEARVLVARRVRVGARVMRFMVADVPISGRQVLPIEMMCGKIVVNPADGLGTYSREY